MKPTKTMLSKVLALLLVVGGMQTIASAQKRERARITELSVSGMFT